MGSYQWQCHVDYLTAFTDVTLGWLHSHFRVCAVEDHPALAHTGQHTDCTLPVHEEGHKQGNQKPSRQGDCSWGPTVCRRMNACVVSEQNTDLIGLGLKIGSRIDGVMKSGFLDNSVSLKCRQSCLNDWSSDGR